MAGWHHWLNGHESEWTPGVGDGQGGLACCGSWGHRESDTTERLNWTELSSISGDIIIIMTIFSSITWDNVEKLALEDQAKEGVFHQELAESRGETRGETNENNTRNSQVIGKSDLWKAEGLCLLESSKCTGNSLIQREGSGRKTACIVAVPASFRGTFTPTQEIKWKRNWPRG